MKTLRISLISLACLLVLSLSALAQGSTSTDGKGSGLTAQQLDQLRGLHAQVLLPTYLPPGYSLSNLSHNLEDGSDLPSYGLEYSNPQGVKFTLVASGDQGEVPIPKGTREVAVANPILGSSALAVVTVGSDSRPSLFLPWIQHQDRWYAFAAPAGTDALPEGEAAKIVQSLRFLQGTESAPNGLSDQPAALKDAITQAIGLLEHKDYKAFLARFIDPEQRPLILKNVTEDKLVASFPDMAARLLDALKFAHNKKTQLIKDEFAVFHLRAIGQAKPLQLRNLKGQWYIEN